MLVRTAVSRKRNLRVRGVLAWIGASDPTPVACLNEYPVAAMKFQDKLTK
jgi:hypothetical protein